MGRKSKLRKYKKFWRELFKSFFLGDRVRVKKTSNWVYKDWEGNIVEITRSLRTGELIFLVRADRSVEEIGVFSRCHLNDPHLIGYFSFKDLELIE